MWVGGICFRIELRDGEEVAVLDHAFGDVLCELHDLGAEVDEEGVT